MTSWVGPYLLFTLTRSLTRRPLLRLESQGVGWKVLLQLTPRRRGRSRQIGGLVSSALVTPSYDVDRYLF